MAHSDKTGDSIPAQNANWTFGGEVATNFDAHVEKSVPLYHQGHDLIIQLSDFFLSDGSICYDLGCSTGSLIAKLQQRNQAKSVRFIGIDQEPAMIEQAKKRGVPGEVEFSCQDILDIEFEPSDMIVAYYTIQFIKPKNRQLIFDRIYSALNWGGALLLFEKVRGPDARFQDIMSSVYQDYKLAQGYTPDNIVAKARSLKGVLEPFSTQGNLDMMKRAGFEDMLTVSKLICFEGFLAIK
jgi:tRNA (cmo5U34)-methyltransferase